jgi:hypothetical protein
MWGKRPKTAMKITPFAPGEAKKFASLLCPGYLCEGITHVSELIAVMDEKASAHPGARMLATLDHVGQAYYTSGHTIAANELDPDQDDETGADEDGVPPLPDFAIRLARMTHAASAVGIDQLRNRLWWSGEGRPHLLSLHVRPDLILDRKETCIQAVPVTHAWETIAAFPNGYFHGDLSPMENLVLARHLEETFGYALFGIGASYLGFRTTAPLSSAQMEDLASFIVDLHAVSNDPDIKLKVFQTLAANDLLILAYVDR